jgi:hypothetical protein
MNENEKADKDDKNSTKKEKSRNSKPIITCSPCKPVVK